jgi:hypothetical protein
MTRDCASPARSTAWIAFTICSSFNLPLASSRDHPRIELSGVLSSCDNVARKSSFRRPAASARRDCSSAVSSSDS